MVVDESYAYVLDTSFGLRVVDISTPTHPIEVGRAYLPFYTWYWPISQKLIVAQDYIYIAADEKGLYIFQVKKGSE